jgi:arsenical pump membrane protein
LPSLALPLLALTLAGVLARPRGVREWIVAAAGALTMIVVGAISPAAALAALSDRWDVFLFFLGLMVIAAIADQSGLLGRLVVAAARAARGRRDLLLIQLAVVAVIVTVTLSNDATVLVLTPLVVDMATRLRVPILPYAYACAYLANTASLAFPISNPANILVLHGAPLSATAFLEILALPALGASVATIVFLLVAHRRELRGSIEVSVATDTDGDAGLVAIGIGLIVVAYLVALESSWPVGVVAAVGGASLILVRLVRGRLDATRLRADVEWGIFPLLAGLIVVVAAAQSAGLASVVADTLRGAAGLGAGGLALIGLGSAALANAMNNLPWALLASAALPVADLADKRVEGAVLIGIDVGPNFSTVGSLATLLWLLILRRKGTGISSLDYVRESWIPSGLALAAALALLVITAPRI